MNRFNSSTPRPAVAALLLLLVCAAFSASAADRYRFQLDDGSIIVGNLVGYTRLHYRVDSATLGQVTIDRARVRAQVRLTAEDQTRAADSARKQAAVSASAGGSTISAELNAIPPLMREKLLRNPRALWNLSRLQSHPGVQRILGNPEAMKALKRGDFRSLGRDPIIQDLLRQPAMQQIIAVVLG